MVPELLPHELADGFRRLGPGAPLPTTNEVAQPLQLLPPVGDQVFVENKEARLADGLSKSESYVQ